MKRAFTAAVAVLLISLVGGAVSASARADSSGARDEERQGFYSVTAQEAKEMIETKDNLVVIDVRSPQEFMQGALPGSKLLPFWDIMKGNHDLPKDKPILLVCAVGGRSLAVGQYLSLRGYSEIANLSGGLKEWARQRVPLPSRPANTTMK